MTDRIEHGDMLKRWTVAEKVIERRCENCGVIFHTIPSRVTHGRGKHCSSACQYAAMRARPKKVSTFICLGCQARFVRPASRLSKHKGAGKFCTRVCRDAHRVQHLHPQYIGLPLHIRGPNWMSQKRKARLRDNRICRKCGAAGTDVHHVVPYRMFKDYRIANDLGNLVTLCKSCHRKADAQIQSLDLRGFRYGF